MAERIDHPPHYGGADNVYECIKVVDAWQLSFALGNALKYLCRAGKKPGVDAAEDLEKASWYLNWEINRLKKQRESGTAEVGGDSPGG